MKKLCALIFLFGCFSTKSNDGDLDTSFGNGGTVTAGSTDVAYSGAIQPDGKILVGGGVGSSFSLSRYSSNGSLDTTFGTNGTVTTIISGFEIVTALLVQKDGKIVAAGTAGAPTVFTLVRYNPDGSLDTSFGANGIVETSMSGGVLNTALLFPDGRIVAAGTTNSADWVLARYNPDGSLDTSFGTNGIVITNLGGTFEYISTMALQDDGKIIVAGQAIANGSYRIARYNTDGSLDTSFGSGGIATTPIRFLLTPATAGHAGSILIRSDGKFYVAGHNASFFFTVGLYNADGSLDTSFGVNGFATGSSGSGLRALSAALQPDGKIVTAAEFTLNRFTPEGTLDTTFGTNGVVTTAITSGSSACQIIVQPDGKLVVTGGNDFSITRYLVDSITVSPFARDLRAKFDLIQKTSG